MRVNFNGIIDRGLPGKERIFFSAVSPSDLSFYVALATLANDASTVMAGNHLAYWFPHRSLRAGDNVILYTGAGADSSNVRQDGGTNHFFYWGLAGVLASDARTRIVLFELDNWQTR